MTVGDVKWLLQQGHYYIDTRGYDLRNGQVLQLVQAVHAVRHVRKRHETIATLAVVQLRIHNKYTSGLEYVPGKTIATGNRVNSPDRPSAASG